MTEKNETPEMSFDFKDGKFTFNVSGSGITQSIGLDTGMNAEQFKKIFEFCDRKCVNHIEKLKDRNSEEYDLFVMIGKTQGKSDEEIENELQEMFKHFDEEHAKVEEFINNIGKDNPSTED